MRRPPRPNPSRPGPPFSPVAPCWKHGALKNSAKIHTDINRNHKNASHSTHRRMGREGTPHDEGPWRRAVSREAHPI
eukprot:scaffold26254_cov112-Isochrysis_galbana.AAC.2